MCKDSKEMFMKTTLYLARHGETEENVARILQGHLPGRLTPKGIEQARQLRDTLKPVGFDVLLCSDLQRCTDTATIVNEPHGLPLHLTPLLRERDWGIHTGCSVRSVAQGIDPSAESVEALFTRAERFLQTVVREYEGKTILAMSHGLFIRVVQGAFYGKSIREVPRLDNAEVRLLVIDGPLSFKRLREESGATAN